MPSEQSTWVIAVPQDGDAEGVVQELTAKIQQQSRNFPTRNIAEFGIPSFKVSQFKHCDGNGLDTYTLLDWNA